MKKIIVGKNEGVAEAVEKIIGIEDEDITLSIPKNSGLAGSLANFHLIKREANAAGKRVVIETVDEQILAFAKESGIESTHPFFDDERTGSSLSDIVPAKGMHREVVQEEAHLKKGRKLRMAAPPQEQEEEVAVPEDEAEESGSISAESAQWEEEIREGTKWGKNWKLIGIVAGVVVFAGAIFWAVTAFGGRATVTIDFTKIPWTYSHQLLADTNASKANPDTQVIPAELFTSQKNLTKLFPATSNQNVSQKAQGTLTIYNAYSSSQQSLVATTRFITSDGKIFRLASAVTIPGAQVTSGKIIPSSIDAAVVADQAGPDYNIAPVSHLTIPGFKGTPKYDGFYGELKAATQGGFIGKKAVPTPADIQKAKDSMTSILQTTLRTGILAGYPADFKILDGASNLNITKLTVNENTDANGNFSVFGEATISAIGFREADLKSLLTTIASKDNPGDVFNDFSPNYSAVQADFKKGTVAFSLTVQGNLKTDFSADDFKTKILGMNVGAAKTLISALPGLADAKVSLWPVWLSSIPKDGKKVQLTVD